MSWWVCNVCEPDDDFCGQWVDSPCVVHRRKEPDHCVDALWVKDLADWRPATPEDLAEIAKSAAKSSWESTHCACLKCRDKGEDPTDD